MEIEVCVSSIEDIVIAERAGATRIELCTAMEVIGVTPTLSYFKLAQSITDLPILAFVRPRAGGFVYSHLEFEIMRRDMKAFYEAGAKSFVFGILTDENEIDVQRCRELIDSVGDECEFIFHKAFDYVNDFEKSARELIDLGFSRILTSGGIGSTEEHLDILQGLISKFSSEIEIMPGGGITEDNISKILNTLDVKSVHLSAKKIQEDVIDYIITDENHLKNVVKIIRSSANN